MTLELLEYAGMLSVARLVDRDWSKRVELWVMEEHGVGSSLKKLYRIIQDSYSFDHIHISRPSFEKLAPYGPEQWIKFDDSFERFNQMLGGHVYEERMFLMDDAKAESYTEKEIVRC